MTQKEFTERTGITPTPEQFDYIHAVYMNTSMDKDQFCEEFKKYGESEILRDVHVRAVNYELQCEQKQEVIENIADYLITKACDYDSEELYFKAVSLIGHRNVVLRKMELGLPFNTEDHMENLLILGRAKQCMADPLKFWEIDPKNVLADGVNY